MKMRFVAVAIAAFLLSGVAAQAQQNGAAAPAPTAAPPPPPVNHIPVATYMEQGNQNGGVNEKTTTVIGTGTSITCTAACTVEVDAMVQATGNTVADAMWSACAWVDNGAMGNCPYLGALPISPSYSAVNFSGFAALAAGTHKVQVTVFGAAAFTVANYTVIYRVYSP